MSPSQGHQVSRRPPPISQSHPIPDSQILDYWWPQMISCLWKGKAGAFLTKVTPKERLEHLDQSVGQPETCSTVFSSSHIAKIANLNGQLSMVILRLFINSKPNSWQLFQLKVHPQFNITHMSFVFIKLRGPMPGASWIEMSTQTSATPTSVRCWICNIS